MDNPLLVRNLENHLHNWWIDAPQKSYQHTNTSSAYPAFSFLYENSHLQDYVQPHTIHDVHGKTRQIIIPLGTLRATQDYLHQKFLDFLPIHPIATAFRKGQSILTNASAHRHAKYSIRVDIRQFYHSILVRDFYFLLDQYTILLPEHNPLLCLPHPITQKPYFFDRISVEKLVRNSCFYNGKLPLGFITSPQLANAIMRPLDNKLVQRLQEKKLGNFTLTRYADDYVFSTNHVGVCRQFVRLLTELLSRDDSYPRLRIHREKTRYMSRLRGNTVITGLRITANQDVRLHPNYKSHVRLQLKHYLRSKQQNEHTDHSLKSLKGHLRYIRYTEPSYYQTLLQQYAGQLKELL